MEDISLKEITYYEEEKMKANVSMSCIGANDWGKENNILTGKIIRYEKQMESSINSEKKIETHHDTSIK